MKQLTLGELIDLLKPLKQHWDYAGTENLVQVVFDFPSTRPNGLHSWRGRYAELAIGWMSTGYSNLKWEDGRKVTSLKDFLNELESAVGKEFEGWKGGKFPMENDTTLWVDNAGDCNFVGIVGILADKYEVTLITKLFSQEN